MFDERENVRFAYKVQEGTMTGPMYPCVVRGGPVSTGALACHDRLRGHDTLGVPCGAELFNALQRARVRRMEGNGRFVVITLDKT